MKLHTIIEKIERGGSTFPLIIKAQDDQGNIGQYVLKYFKTDPNINIYPHVKEFIGNILASQFGLNTPNPGVVELSSDELIPFIGEEKASLIESGPKFCTQLIEGAAIYNPFLGQAFLNDFEKENVFAYDSLILNADRGGPRNKPNLLVSDEGFHLIDHELILPFYDSIKSKSDLDYLNYFTTFNLNQHLFFNDLKSRRKKDDLFNEMFEYLRRLNIRSLEDIFVKLESIGFDCGEKEICLNYFKWLVQESNRVFEIIGSKLS